jgi:hypothetical protein
MRSDFLSQHSKRNPSDSSHRLQTVNVNFKGGTQSDMVIPIRLKNDESGKGSREEAKAEIGNRWLIYAGSSEISPTTLQARLSLLIAHYGEKRCGLIQIDYIESSPMIWKGMPDRRCAHPQGMEAIAVGW